MTRRQKKIEKAARAIVPYLHQSVDESPIQEVVDIDVPVAEYEYVRPLLTSRVIYDLVANTVECHVELMDGTRAQMTMAQSKLREPLGAALMARVLQVHTALLFWGVGSPSWHRRDVGRGACLLLALLLPQDQAGFADALAGPEHAALYLKQGTP